MVPGRTIIMGLLALSLTVGGAADGSASEPEPPPSEGPTPSAEPATEEEALGRIKEPFSEIPGSPSTADGVSDGCDGDYSYPDWQEDTQEFFRDISCHTFRWFDGLFGQQVDYPEESVNGLALLGLGWNEYEGVDTRARFRVRAPLPNWDNRWDVFLGRGDEEAFIQDTEAQDPTFYNPGLINRGQDDSLLLGLGGRPRSGRKGWDWSAGVRLRAKPIPYLRLRYYYYKQFDARTDLRVRQTFYWRSDDGFGTTTRGDVAHAFRPQDVLRWEGVVTLSEESIGTEWYVGQTWYHLMPNQRAWSLLTFARGETDNPAGIQDIGFNMIWRQPFTRDWMWLSVGPTLTWPRFVAEDERELSLGFTVQLEMEFGNWVYR